MTTGRVYLAVETGGTKIIARLADDRGACLAERRWPTTTPDAALEQIVTLTETPLPPSHRLTSAGIAAFGPVLVDPGDPNRGRVLDTPKPGWAGSNLRASLAARIGVPVDVDTDVNAAAIAERALGAGRGLASVAYLRIGTGIGTGIGAGLAGATGSLRGALHPEIGHFRLIRAQGDDTASSCRFHGDCAEGLAAGPALSRRLGGDAIGDRPDVRGRVGSYIAQLIEAIVLAWSPHGIVLGGGVATAPGMFEVIRTAYHRGLSSYGAGDRARADDFIRRAILADSGLEGAMLMTRNADEATQREQAA